MSADPSNKQQNERDKRIEELKRRAAELSGGKMASGEVNECPPEVAEQFWEHVVAYEEAPWTTLFKQLEDAGMQLPAPDTLDDEQLNAKLWELIRRLAFMSVFLENTDHLSDRELYTELWSDILREETKDLPPEAEIRCHLDLVGSGSEEDMNMYLKFYADEDFRSSWSADNPNDPIPELEDPPFDRDRYLPQPDYQDPSDPEPQQQN